MHFQVSTAWDPPYWRQYVALLHGARGNVTPSQAQLCMWRYDCCRHFFKVQFAIFQAIHNIVILKMPIFPYTLGNNRIIFYLATGNFRGSSRSYPRPPSRLERLIDWLELNGTFSTIRLYHAFRSYNPHPYSTPFAAFGASIVVPPWHQNPGDATGRHHFWGNVASHMAGHGAASHGGGTVSRRTAHSKLTKLHWPSRKCSPKRLDSRNEVEGHNTKNLTRHFQIRSGADDWRIPQFWQGDKLVIRNFFAYVFIHQPLLGTLHGWLNVRHISFAMIAEALSYCIHRVGQKSKPLSRIIKSY